MKFSKILAVAALAALTVFSSCKEEEKLGAASISLDPTEVTLTAEAGATATVDLTATREWTVSGVPDWLTVTPNSGAGSNKKQLITLTAKSNDDIERSANISFTIGFADAVLKVKQEGEAGSIEEALLYKNNFDKEDAVNNNGWPYLDKFEGWKNEEGNGIAGISYEFAGISARQSGKLSNNTEGYSLYAGSGRNKLFFAKSSKFAVKDIALDGKTALALSFGGQRYGQDDKDNTFNSEEFKVFVSIDGVKGVEVPVSFKAGSAPVGNWDLATSKFTVPEGTEKLTVVFKCDASKTSGTGGVYSIDDLQLAVSTGGDAIDFSKGESLGLDQSANIPDSDEVTDLATVIRQTPGTVVTILNATVTAVNTRGYVIGKGDKAIYVYKNADPKLAVGDKVSIIGTFKYYWGEYELVDASEKKTGTATPEYPKPVEIDAAYLANAKKTAATDEASTGYKGTWYPEYAHFTATIKKNGNYTNFIIEGAEGYISFVNAPSDMYKDNTGTEFSEGNNVEVLGYYTGYASNNDYHQFIAVSVTGEATYEPIEATLEGDDVLVVSNAGHDLGLVRQDALDGREIVFGDSKIAFGSEGSSKPAYYETSLRIYNSNTFTISSPRTISKIVFLFDKNADSDSYYPSSTEGIADSGSVAIDESGNNPIGTWTGTAKSVKFTHPAENKPQWRFSEVAVVYSGAAEEPFLSVSPASINVKADETSAKFTVQSNVAWTIASDNEAFVAAPASGEGTAEVTVSFPANESLTDAVVAKLTVSAAGLDDALVTITQAKVIDENAVTDIKAACWDVANNTAVELYNVVVSEAGYKNYIVTDGTSAIFVYANNASHGRKVGEKLNLSGKTSWHNGLLELASPKVEKVVSEGNTVSYPTPLELTGAVLNATYTTQSNNSPFYAKFTAKVTIDGNYVQFTPEGASNYLSLQDLPNAVKDNFTAGDEITVYGYYGGWHSKNNFHLFYYVRHEAAGSETPDPTPTPSLKADKTAIPVDASATEASINITSNIAWQASASEGATLDKTSGEGNATVKVSFPANENTEKTQSYTVTLTGEGVADVVVTVTQAKAEAQGGEDPEVTDLATITEITTKNTSVDIKGATVVAVHTRGFIISDGTNHVYVYKGSDPGVAIGDVVNVTGTTDQYGGGFQISSPTITKTGTATPVYGEATEINATNYSTFSNADKHPAYVKFEGTCAISGSFVNIYFVPETNPYASFMYAPSGFADKFEAGATYRAYGFCVGKSTNYHQIVWVSSEKTADAPATLKVDRAEIAVAASATAATINITSNVAWQASASTGASLDKTSGEGDAALTVSFPANENTEEAKPYTVTITGEGVAPVTVTITQAKALAEGGNSYTIVFANNTNSATAIDASKQATTLIGEGTEYVTAKPFTVDSGNCYYGDTKQCIRVGKSGNAAQLSIALSEAGKVTATSIVVNAQTMSGSKNEGAKLNVNSIGAQTPTAEEAADYVYTFATPTAIEKIVLASDKAIKIFSITVNY